MDYFLFISTYALCFFTTYGIISFVEDIKEGFKKTEVFNLRLNLLSASVKPEIFESKLEDSESDSESSESELSENEFEFEPENHESDPTWEIPKKRTSLRKRKRI